MVSLYGLVGSASKVRASARVSLNTICHVDGNPEGTKI